jgi:hypothetical protein
MGEHKGGGEQHVNHGYREPDTPRYAPQGIDFPGHLHVPFIPHGFTSPRPLADGLPFLAHALFSETWPCPS